MAGKKRKRPKTRVAMATRRKISRALKTYHRKKKQKEAQRREKISRTLKLRAAAKRPPQPLADVIAPPSPRQSLGDFIIATLNQMAAERKPVVFQLPEGRQVGGFDMKDQHPDLPGRFGHNQEISLELHFVYFTDDGELHENTITVFFNSGVNNEEFWHNYHDAVRNELERQIEELQSKYDEISVFVARAA